MHLEGIRWVISIFHGLLPCIPNLNTHILKSPFVHSSDRRQPPVRHHALMSPPSPKRPQRRAARRVSTIAMTTKFPTHASASFTRFTPTLEFEVTDFCDLRIQNTGTLFFCPICGALRVRLRLFCGRSSWFAVDREAVRTVLSCQIILRTPQKSSWMWSSWFQVPSILAKGRWTKVLSWFLADHFRCWASECWWERLAVMQTHAQRKSFATFCGECLSAANMRGETVPPYMSKWQSWPKRIEWDSPT